MTDPKTEMMPTFDLDRFDAYVRGEADAEERSAIETLLREDAAFAAEWVAHADAVRAVERHAVREQITAARQRYTTTEETRTIGREATVRPLWRRSLAIAAAIAAVLVAGGLWLLDGSTSSTPDQLALRYFEPAIGLPTRLGPAEDMQFEGGMVDYKLGEFDLAIAAWEPLRELSPMGDTLAFYIGVAQLGAGRPTEAVETLAGVNAVTLSAEARWYRALALLRTDDVAGARTLLEGLGAAGGARAEEAKAVLERL